MLCHLKAYLSGLPNAMTACVFAALNQIFRCHKNMQSKSMNTVKDCEMQI